MADLYGIGAMVIAVFLLLLTVYIVIWFMKYFSEKEIEAKQVSNTPVPMDDGKFIKTFIAPIYEDGLEEMETATECVKVGFASYRHGAYVEAGEEFIAATDSIDNATRKFREMLALIEDEVSADTKKARERLAECKRFREMARKMEAACDMMIANKPDEARALEDSARHLSKLADEWSKT